MMLNIKKILLGVDFPKPALPEVHQAATLARHFNSEIVMVHAVTEQSHAVGVPDDPAEFAGWDMFSEIRREASKNLDQSLGPELEGLAIRSMLLKGDPAQAILQTAQVENADLIMMASHGYTFDRFLQGSVTAEVLHGSECPVWTGAYIEEAEGSQTPNSPRFLYGGASVRDKQLMAANRQGWKQQPMQEFALRNILCAVDLGPRSEKAVSRAAAMAAEFGAHLTLAHVTASVELWGPGGDYDNQKWKEELVGDASREMSKLQQDMGTKADVIINSGDVPTMLRQAATQTKADLLVTGCYPYGGNLRIHGYAIICAVSIPVLSV